MKLTELERLLQAGVGTAQNLIQGFGLFHGPWRGSIGRPPTASQIEFIDLVVNYLAEEGYIDPARLYESPFTDLSLMGVEGVFPADQVGELFGVLSQIRNHAAAAAAAA